tara:strand:- start:72 stop:266 length:195 start_codon:yes stop_codon:yes gene_type:complete
VKIKSAPYQTEKLFLKFLLKIKSIHQIYAGITIKILKKISIIPKLIPCADISDSGFKLGLKNKL